MPQISNKTSKRWKCDVFSEKFIDVSGETNDNDIPIDKVRTSRSQRPS